MRTEKQHIYLINYSTECEVETINDEFQKAFQACITSSISIPPSVSSIKFEAIPDFEEITKDWNNDIKQSIIDKVSEILKDAYGFDKEIYAEFQWVEGIWQNSTLDVKYAKIYGQINYEKTIRYLNNRDGYEIAKNCRI